MKILCGPSNDIRELDFKLPLMHRRIGVLVSGGLDSALLFYLLMSMTNERYKIVPFTIRRNDGSSSHAQPVIDYVTMSLGLEPITTTYLDITEQDTEKQVAAGMREISKFNVNKIFIGLIDTMPEHTLHVPVHPKPKDSYGYAYPLKDLTKAHIVDLVIKLGQQGLFNITHSCVYPENRCRICNRCVEREWAFSELGLVDPGSV
jgi:7-cyano-7-deazaguanine synthase in queuosine biosynthesis